MSKQAFVIKTVAVAVPAGISQKIIIDWLRENFSTILVQPVTPDYVSLEALDDRGVNQALQALQESAHLLQHRTMVTS